MGSGSDYGQFVLSAPLRDRQPKPFPTMLFINILGHQSLKRRHPLRIQQKVIFNQRGQLVLKHIGIQSGIPARRQCPSEISAPNGFRINPAQITIAFGEYISPIGI
jgi:hypothetical protein